jgi:signal transduction histidine kinase
MLRRPPPTNAPRLLAAGVVLSLLLGCRTAELPTRPPGPLDWSLEILEQRAAPVGTRVDASYAGRDTDGNPLLLISRSASLEHGESHIQLWNLDGGSLVLALSLPGRVLLPPVLLIEDSCFVPGGRLLASLSWEGGNRLLDMHPARAATDSSGWVRGSFDGWSLPLNALGDGITARLRLLEAGDFSPVPGTELLAGIVASHPTDYGRNRFELVLLSADDPEPLWRRPLPALPMQLQRRDLTGDGVEDWLLLVGATFNSRRVEGLTDDLAWVMALDGESGRHLHPPLALGAIHPISLLWLSSPDPGGGDWLLLADAEGRSPRLAEIDFNAWRIGRTLELPAAPDWGFLSQAQGQERIWLGFNDSRRALIVDPPSLSAEERWLEEHLRPLLAGDLLPQRPGGEWLAAAGSGALLLYGGDGRALARLERSEVSGWSAARSLDPARPAEGRVVLGAAGPRLRPAVLGTTLELRAVHRPLAPVFRALRLVLPLTFGVLLLLLVQLARLTLFQRQVRAALFRRAGHPIVVLRGQRAWTWNAEFAAIVGRVAPRMVPLRPPRFDRLIAGTPLEYRLGDLLRLVEIDVGEADRNPGLTVALHRHGRSVQYTVSALSVQARGRIRGRILFFEDLTEVIDERRRTAWSLLAHGVGHMIKSPLQAIRLNTESLLMGWHGRGEAREDVERLGRLLNECAEIEQILSRFLTLGDGQLQPRPAAPGPMLQRFVERYRRRLPPGMRFDLECTPDSPRVRVDEYHLLVALVNLWDNAVQVQAGEGGILTRCWLASPEDDVLPGGLCIEVLDEGPGLDDETLRNLFTPYYSRRFRGHGIGLSQVRHIVERHGGQVRARNAEQGGAAFRIWLPADDGEQLA